MTNQNTDSIAEGIFTLSFGSGLIGGSIGFGIGFALGGGIGAAWGTLIGWTVGFWVGFLIGFLQFPEKKEWSYAKPSFTTTSFHARPNPALEDTTCSITIQYQVDGNTDHALCEITHAIEAEEATPPQSLPLPPVRNTSSSFGRHTYPFLTTWDDPHDGRLLTGILTLVASKGGQTYSITASVPSIRVPDNDNP